MSARACGGRLARASLALAVLTLASISTPAGAQAQGAPGACGSNTVVVNDAVAYRTAAKIYADERASAEVTQDSDHIDQSPDLLRAVADDDAPAALAAVTRLVYTPLWHIVRLRVVTRSGRVLADVGGPDILAPVSGELFWDGRLVGSFVMSVQDDVGYRKLVTTIAGVPIEIYSHGAPLLGSWPDPPPSPPPSGATSIDGRAYHVRTYDLTAFPSGTLQASVLVRAPSAALTQLSCPAVRLAALGATVRRIALQFGPHSLNPLPEHTFLFLRTALPFIDGPMFILSPSGTELAGTDELSASPMPAPPTVFPVSGPVSYDGSSWLVFSFTPDPGLIVYLLAPA